MNNTHQKAKAELTACRYLWSLYGGSYVLIKDIFLELELHKEDDELTREVFFRIIRDHYGRTEREIKFTLRLLRMMQW